MGYLHIDNLYKNQAILLFRECYALEKIHGTSAHVGWKDGALRFFSGGEKHERFVSLFATTLVDQFVALGHSEVTVYGEAYGGSQQGQAYRYGKALRFVVFDVRVGESWLSVPQAADVAFKLGLEFVAYRRVSTDLEALDAERDAPSDQARRNGVEGDQPKEGVVLRPIVELTLNNGERIIAKHKRDEERETKTPRHVDPGKLQVLEEARSIAEEWVTDTRLAHVLDKVQPAMDFAETGLVIHAMVEDVLREGAGEIVDSQQARKAIATRTAKMFKAYVQRMALEKAEK